MLTAISRYGVRTVPDTARIVDACRRQGTFVQGPDIERFERAFERRLGHGTAIATSYGRMAFFHILKALDLPPGSEILMPALTFWVMPELARVVGLRPVFVDVDPRTFTIDPAAAERAVGPNTRAIVPTHLYGLPCDMDAIMALAARHGLAVIEDCAHALGATYRGRPVGTFGDGAIFSFQTLKPLNAFGGGLALVRNPDVAARVRAQVDALPWPDTTRVSNRLKLGGLLRRFTRPVLFTATVFPILWAASWVNANPDVYLWEPIRSLDPLPDSYTERIGNVQAALGLAGLEMLDRWTADTRAHARRMDDALRDLPGIRTPLVPAGSEHVYYQYCVYTQARDQIVLKCIRRGVDIETLHVDVCSSLPLFDAFKADAPGAEQASEAIQVPVHASLTDGQLTRVARTLRRALIRHRANGTPSPAEHVWR